MVYGGSSIVSIESSDNSEGSGDVGCDDWWAERTDPALDSVSNLYFKLDIASL